MPTQSIESKYYANIQNPNYLKERHKYLQNTTKKHLDRQNLLDEQIHNLHNKIDYLVEQKNYKKQLYYHIITKDYKKWKKKVTDATSTD